jgi:uncharacterized alkaline shock family protein YloU
MNRSHFSKLAATGAVWVAAAVVCLTIPLTAEARDVRNTTRTNVNRDVNVNRNVNVNVNTRRNVDIDVDVDRHHRHPIATAAAVGATMAVTSAVIGSMVYTLPPACSTVVVNGIAYSQCGGVWYQPQYMGSTVQYVVINPPR